MWGIAQPVAGAAADRWGPRPVMLAGALLVATATAAVPLAHSSAMLILLIGVLSAIGAGAIGPALLISAASRWIPEVKRNFVNGIVNAGGSFSPAATPFGYIASVERCTAAQRALLNTTNSTGSFIASDTKCDAVGLPNI